jgi:hypothetical protein
MHINSIISGATRRLSTWRLLGRTRAVESRRAACEVWRVAQTNGAGTTVCSLWLISVAAEALYRYQGSIAWLALAAVCLLGYGTILIRSQAARTQLDDALTWLVAKRNAATHRALRALKTCWSWLRCVYSRRCSSDGPLHGVCSCGWQSKPQTQARRILEEHREHVSRDHRATAAALTIMGVSHVDCPRCGPSSLKAAGNRNPIPVIEVELSNGDLYSPSEAADRHLSGGLEQEYFSRMARRLPG